MPFYGYNRPGAKVSEGVRESFWLQGMMCRISGRLLLHQSIFRNRPDRRPEKDRCADLILHGDDDQIVPLDNAGMLRKVGQERKAQSLQGAPHGMCTTAKEQVNADLLAFINE